MSATISFSTIPANLRVPMVAVEFDNSQAGANQTDQVALLIGGTLVAQPMVATLCQSVATARSIFGRGSILARMAEQYLANDNIGTVYLVPVPDPTGGVAATKVMTITGTATAAGSLSLYLGGQAINAAVANGDTPSVQAASLVAAAQLLPDLPSLLTATAGVITMTALHKGISGNSIDARMNYYGLANGEALPAGVTVAIAVGVVGTLDSDLSGLDAALGDTPFDFIGSGINGAAALASLKSMMNNTTGRWSPLRQVYGHVFSCVSMALGALQTYGPSNNDPHGDVFGYYDSPTPPWEATAQILGTLAPAIKDDPARPVQTLQISGFLAPPFASRFTMNQKQALLNVGIALLAHDNAGNTSILRAITTYQLNQFGQSDQSYLDCETLYTLMAVQRQLTSAFATKFGRAKIADDGTAFGPGQPIVTPLIMKSEIVAQYNIMEYNGLVEDADAMSAATIVLRNLVNPGRMDVLWAPYLVQGLRDTAIKNQFRLFSAVAALAAAGA